MKLLLYSGLLYLIGIATVLYLRPSLMFAADGTWKEFGIGRDSEHYTWMPFWLFAISWAVITYIIVLVIASANALPGVEVVNEVDVTEIKMTPKMRRNMIESASLIDHEDVTAMPENIMNTVAKSIAKKTAKAAEEMKPGYYILNTEETLKKGIPKYIYLGPEAPNLIFNKGADME